MAGTLHLWQRAVRGRLDDHRNLFWLGVMISRKDSFVTLQKLATLTACFQTWQEFGGFAFSVQCSLGQAALAELIAHSYKLRCLAVKKGSQSCFLFCGISDRILYLCVDSVLVIPTELRGFEKRTY